METKERNYRSRYRDPDPTNAPDPALFPLERDLKILKRLDIRRFSTSINLHHFIGGDYLAFIKRLGQMYDGTYIGRIKEHLHPDTVHARHMVYFLTEKGKRVLIEAGYQPTFSSTTQYLHECLTSFIYDSVEIGAEERGIEFEGWDTLQLDERVPARHYKSPFTVKLSESLLRLDGSPLVLRKGGKSLCIPGMEVDRNTEPLRSYQLRENWKGKLLAIKEFMHGKHYTKHYGFDSCLIPIVTTNATHMLNIMSLAHETVGKNGYLLFKAVPDWPKARNFPKPNGDMLKEPWHRVGGGEFDLGGIF